MDSDRGIVFLKWALPVIGYRWDGFKKPRRQVLKRIRSRIHELELSGAVKAWSAGCCNSEEPYNLAIIRNLLAKKISAMPDIPTLSTDHQAKLLERARESTRPGHSKS